MVAWLCSLVVLAGALRGACAHPQFGVSTINRYGRLVLREPTLVYVYYTVLFGDIPALPLRKAADTDGNGQLSAVEQAALASSLQATIQAGVTLQAEGRLAPLLWHPPTLDLADAAVVARGFSLDCEARVQLTAPADRSALSLRYQDHSAFPSIGEIELRVEEAPAVSLLSATGPTLRPDAPQGETARLFHTFGPAAVARTPFSVELRVAQPRLTAAPPPVRSRVRPGPLVLAFLLAFLGIGGVAWFLRQRHR